MLLKSVFVNPSDTNVVNVYPIFEKSFHNNPLFKFCEFGFISNIV